MIDYYAARAPEYDAVYQKPERQADLRAIEAWLPAHFADAAVLEVACGTGYWTQFIAPLARRVLALDAAPETLRIASNRVTAAHVQFDVGDAYALPSRRGSVQGFTAGFAGFWLSHVPKQRVREFLRGLGAALEPGAKVVLIDNLYVEGSSTPIRQRDGDDDAGNTYQVRTLQNGSSHRVLKNFPSEAELRSAVVGLASELRYTTWQHFWALEFTYES